jgi:hypothetical protein
MYDILFKAASQTIMELAIDTKHLGANVGLISILHTWGQAMTEHPHLHCIMPAGGLSFDKQHWVHPNKKDNFLVHYKVLSAKFRGKFLDLLIKAFNAGLLSLARKNSFKEFVSELYKKEWVVNIQAPFGKTEKVLEYLSRYVFRIAISNRRIIEVKDGKVLFSWKDYRTGRFKKMKLEIDEFIRRFLLHILPAGFFKVRYYGTFSSRCRKENNTKAKEILNQEKELIKQEAFEDGKRVWEKQDSFWDDILKMTQNYQKPNCPKCKKGRLQFAGVVPIDSQIPD